MEDENTVLQKSFAFAIRIVKLRKFLLHESPYKEYEISKQLVRSGTSIGANVEEAQGAQSQADFLSKIQISYKEARESAYWVKLLKATDYITPSQADSLLVDLDELCRMLSKIIMTTKQNLACKE